ncbi:MutS-related protein [Robiginitalea biformata]|uniref:DNA mismatch repair protein mutS n=1 Tax=Robiginitalea biformata (strain ATCC BAA-864 / DSM 15991 / KCTC 12146 / HTCC2501) TaxID=313596 RepID=A4CGH9_ROBBH|nr:DNA mismatch repair protein MutS [Robiginitalea biformata]EAR16037.1 DNA mismatch repair protein mutS [Robiginitalea biformata HTCC2501]
MTTPREAYAARLKGLREEREAISRRLHLTALFRVLSFLGAGGALYLAAASHGAFAAVSLVLLALFGWLVGRNEDLKYQRRKRDELIRLNETETRVLDLDYEDLPEGTGYRDSGHAFSEDLDLFGPGSFFQYANRCGLLPGAERLAKWLTDNDTGSVRGKQEAIRELAPQVNWRQEYYAVARISDKGATVHSALDWLEGYGPFTRPTYRYAPYLFGLVSLGLLGAFLAGWVTPWAVGGVFLSGLVIAGYFAKRVGKLAADASRVQDVFEGYARLVAHVEDREFSSEMLCREQGKLRKDGEAVSVLLKRFSRHLSALDQRNNLLVALLGNGFLLWDLLKSRAVEAWITAHGSQVRHWFGGIAALDAWCSLGNFAFNHPDYTYPGLEVAAYVGDSGQPVSLGGNADRPFVVAASGLAHPLLPPGNRVANDFEIREGGFFVITGANMAGKSTFLRTLSLSLVMANCGLPVCATSFSYTPLPLISSMRTSDSLARSESYFFAELKRLQFLIAALEERPSFVVLDEILKGTNSTDKAKGSRLFLGRLVRMGATGVIATHDLSLCQVADTEPRVENWHFDAEIRQGELHFDYRLKPGVCHSMNASFLLRKMGIVEDPEGKQPS